MNAMTQLQDGVGAYAGRKQGRLSNFLKGMRRSKYLYLLIFPVVVYFIIFNYIPMYGIIISFKDFSPRKGILGSDWVGLENFYTFFRSPYAWRLICNTVVLSLYGMIAGFPAPIILALLINEVRTSWFKRSVQTIVYLPHFISTVVICGMLVSFLSPSSGIINTILGVFGIQPIHFLAEPGWFRHVYVWSGIWQSMGWGSIIYLAALSGVDVALYEAATVDGATKWDKMIYITLPAIVPTIVILFILNMGSLFSVGYEKVFLLYNPLTYPTADVISTYVYRQGIQNAEYSYTTAIGLFNSIINFVMLYIVNAISRRVSDISLW